MKLARFTRVNPVTYSGFGNAHDLVHSVSSQNETPHFGIPNLLLPTAQQKKRASRSLFTVRSHFRYRNYG